MDLYKLVRRFVRVNRAVNSHAVFDSMYNVHAPPLLFHGVGCFGERPPTANLSTSPKPPKVI